MKRSELKEIVAVLKDSGNSKLAERIEADSPIYTASFSKKFLPKILSFLKKYGSPKVTKNSKEEIYLWKVDGTSLYLETSTGSKNCSIRTGKILRDTIEKELKKLSIHAMA